MAGDAGGRMVASARNMLHDEQEGEETSCPAAFRPVIHITRPNDLTYLTARLTRCKNLLQAARAALNLIPDEMTPAIELAGQPDVAGAKA